MNWEAISVVLVIVGGIAGALATVFWWIIQKLRIDLDALRQELTAHRLYAAENYVTSNELAKAFDGITASLKEIFSKLDKLMESKADKDCHR